MVLVTSLRILAQDVIQLMSPEAEQNGNDEPEERSDGKRMLCA
jgi:hypothetical protein